MVCRVGKALTTLLSAPRFRRFTTDFLLSVVCVLVSTGATNDSCLGAVGRVLSLLPSNVRWAFPPYFLDVDPVLYFKLALPSS